MKLESKKMSTPQRRNWVALNPLLRKGHAHDKPRKALRKRVNDHLRKYHEDDSQAA